jgi:D-alanyl-lipoteichoic acid acyltransferase DltB (MBOAT superfamily)
MPFKSVAFILGVLPLVLPVYAVAARFGQDAGKYSLIVASLGFYALCAPVYLPLLLGSVLGNIALVRAGRVAWGVVANLAMLCWFKYAMPLIWPGSSLPPGISFFTFSQIGLLLWAGAPGAVVPRFVDQALFAVFFPAILAGPILNPADTLPSIKQDVGRRLDVAAVATGLGFFCIGLVKKGVLADPLGPLVAAAFDDPGHVGTQAAWIGAVGWYLQLYFDFSGYSDMAIGLGTMFGVLMPDNFDQPYRAASITQYWQRWHMSLTRFLTGNVHAPLTLRILRGRRARGLPINEMAQRRPLGFLGMIGGPIVATMVLAGVWHGASASYLVFGLVHAGFLLVNHAWRVWRLPRLPFVAGVLATQAAVLVGAVIFRAASPADAWSLFAAMAGRAGDVDPQAPLQAGWLCLLLAVVWLAPATRAFMQRDWRPSPAMAMAMGCLATVGLLACGGTQAFVYFSF